MEHIALYVNSDETLQKLNQYIAEGWVLNPELKVVKLDTVAIYHLVKYSEEELEAMELVEADVEAEEQKRIMSIKSVDIAEADKYLAEGYELMKDKVYAKTVTLIKTEKKNYV